MKPSREGVRRAFGRWLRDVSISAKLAMIVLVFVTIIVVLLAGVVVAFEVESGIRAYVGGESQWSKGEKDAANYLEQYVRYRRQQDFDRYQSAIAIPLGDHQARLELLKDDYDYDVVEQAFMQGGNVREDVPHMIFVFRHFRDVSYIATALNIWDRADLEIFKLIAVGDRLHASLDDGLPENARESARLDQIEQINARIRPMELEFSATLGAGARWSNGVIILSIVAFGLLLMVAGLWVTWRITREMREGLAALHEGAIRVTRGEMSESILVRSGDELGALTVAFNEMMTQRRGAEEALRGATEFRDKVMQSATNSIHAFDLLGRFTLSNPRTTEMTGYSAGQLIGMSYEKLFSAERLPEIQKMFEQVVSGRGPVFNHETPIQRADGSSITISLSAAVMTKEGQIIGIVGTAEDITQRKIAEIALAERAEELARSNAELEQFAYVASHDLQEPLRAVSGYAQLLARRFGGQGSQDADEFVGFIVDGVQRMRDLIEGLLAYSRVSRRDKLLQPTEVDAALNVALANLKAAIEDSRATIVREPLPRVSASPPQLAQLFQNLIGNALKFRGSEPPRIEIRVAREAGEWVISVADNGIGIDPQYSERIFLLFQRLHTREHYPGNGLGLAICRRIVELHGGRLWVEEGNPGSIFRFTLPLMPIENSVTIPSHANRRKS